jgi:hypothetical protein
MRRAGKRVLTIHSGSFLKEFARLGRVGRFLALRALRGFDAIICVNEDQKHFLERRVAVPLQVIPAFLPSTPLPDVQIPKEVRALWKDVDAAVVTSGTGEPLYDFPTVLRGVELAQERLPIRLGLVVATYKSWQDDYWGPVEGSIRGSPVRTVVTRNLSPDQFLTVAARSRLYIRGSLRDGDAMAIREAASVGAQILATDAASRPAGSALFKASDPAGLAELIVLAVQDASVGRLAAAEACADNYPAICRVYGLEPMVEGGASAVGGMTAKSLERAQVGKTGGGEGP